MNQGSGAVTIIAYGCLVLKLRSQSQFILIRSIFFGEWKPFQILKLFVLVFAEQICKNLLKWLKRIGV